MQKKAKIHSSFFCFFYKNVSIFALPFGSLVKDFGDPSSTIKVAFMVGVSNFSTGGVRVGLVSGIDRRCFSDVGERSAKTPSVTRSSLAK